MRSTLIKPKTKFFLLLFSFSWHVYSQRFSRHITTLHHLSLSWTASSQSSTSKVFRYSATTSIRILLLVTSLGFLPCGLYSNAILTVLFSLILFTWLNHCIFWLLSKIITGTSYIISYKIIVVSLLPVLRCFINDRSTYFLHYFVIKSSQASLLLFGGRLDFANVREFFCLIIAACNLTFVFLESFWTLRILSVCN